MSHYSDYDDYPIRLLTKVTIKKINFDGWRLIVVFTAIDNLNKISQRQPHTFTTIVSPRGAVTNPWISFARPDEDILYYA